MKFPRGAADNPCEERIMSVLGASIVNMTNARYPSESISLRFRRARLIYHQALGQRISSGDRIEGSLFDSLSSQANISNAGRPARLQFDNRPGRCIQTLAEAINRLDGPCPIIAIDGPSNSGKTTLARALKHKLQQLGRDVFTIEVDWWLMPRDLREEKYKEIFSRGKPFLQEEQGMVRLDQLLPVLAEIDRFRAGARNKCILRLDHLYNRQTGQNDAQFSRKLGTDTIILLEGHYSAREDFQGFVDFSVLVNAVQDVALARKIQRSSYRPAEETEKMVTLIDFPSFYEYFRRVAGRHDVYITNNDPVSFRPQVIWASENALARMEEAAGAVAGKVKLAASLMEVAEGDFDRLLTQAVIGGVDELHADIIDGKFHSRVIEEEGFRRLEAYKKMASEVPATAHLMVQDPLGEVSPATGKNYLESCAELGVDRVLIHLKAFGGNLAYLKQTVKAALQLNLRVGLVLNPDEGLAPDLEKKILPYLDRLTVMGVWPGAGGQKFLPDTIDRAEKVIERLRELGLDQKIEVEIDGGLRNEHVMNGARAGVRVFSGWTLYNLLNLETFEGLPLVKALTDPAEPRTKETEERDPQLIRKWVVDFLDNTGIATGQTVIHVNAGVNAELIGETAWRGINVRSFEGKHFWLLNRLVDTRIEQLQEEGASIRGWHEVIPQDFIAHDKVESDTADTVIISRYTYTREKPLSDRIREILRALTAIKPGGRIVLTAPAGQAGNEVNLLTQVMSALDIGYEVGSAGSVSQPFTDVFGFFHTFEIRDKEKLGGKLKAGGGEEGLSRKLTEELRADPWNYKL